MAIAAGFIVGFARGKKSSDKKNSHSQVGLYGTGFTSLFIAELKRLAAQQAMIYISDMVDQKIIPKLSPKRESSEKQANNRPEK